MGIATKLVLVGVQAIAWYGGESSSVAIGPNLVCMRRSKQFGIYVGDNRELFEGIGNMDLALVEL